MPHAIEEITSQTFQDGLATDGNKRYLYQAFCETIFFILKWINEKAVDDDDSYVDRIIVGHTPQDNQKMKAFRCNELGPGQQQTGGGPVKMILADIAQSHWMGNKHGKPGFVELTGYDQPGQGALTMHNVVGDPVVEDLQDRDEPPRLPPKAKRSLFVDAEPSNAEDIEEVEQQ